MKKTLILFFITLFVGSVQSQDFKSILINEFMADNATTIFDSDFQNSADWIEIYNNGTNVVNLNGLFLTDDLSNKFKWPIPVSSIRPGWHKLFWADARDSAFHTNFKLAKSAGVIALFDSAGSLIDSISYIDMQEDKSLGRYPDGADTWYIFETPTPVSANSNEAYIGILSDPVFSIYSGFYSEMQYLELLSDNSAGSIYYTLDGSIPNENSLIYELPLEIPQTTVVRAKIIAENYISSNVKTQSYFINESSTLPVLSIATAPANLWSDDEGIYVEGTNGITGYCSSQPRNWNRDWEKEVWFEFFEDDKSLAFGLDAGMKIGGGCTRLYPQKTLAIYARDVYGNSKIHYKMFDDKPINQFNNFNLRNSGQDFYRALFRDGFMQTLVKDRMDIEWQAYRPAILFLNGEYWGIHGIREKHNEHYLAANHGVDPDNVDILTGNAVVKNGDNIHYKKMIDFIEDNNMALAANYEYIKTQMDINQYINYQIAEIYFANIDWPGGNIKYWRPKTPEGKWRWILFDLDLGFGAHGYGQYDSNTLANATATIASYYANPPWSTFLFRSLLENSNFRNEFIQRFASHLNTTFKPERVLNVMDGIKTRLAPEIPRHITKWETSISFADSWDDLVDVMIEFAEKRPQYMTEHIKEKFNLNGSANLILNNPDPSKGRIKINGVEITENSFTGQYFKNIPIRLKAIPQPGFSFAGWQGDVNSLLDTMTIQIYSDFSINALFEDVQDEPYSGLFINEIQALNSSTYSDNRGEYDDWIELYNGSKTTIDLTDLFLTDDFQNPDKWQIKQNGLNNVFLEPGNFLVIWADEDSSQGFNHCNFKLSGSGEELAILSKEQSGFKFIDSLTFGAQLDNKSLGRLPDGGSELIVFDIPTPGRQNKITSNLEEFEISSPFSFNLRNYPNPFNSSTQIEFNLKRTKYVSLKIYDTLGNLLDVLQKGYMPAGNHILRFDGSNYPSGIYFYILSGKKFSITNKLLLLK